jgi:hypothetical protein
MAGGVHAAVRAVIAPGDQRRASRLAAKTLR